MDGNKEKHPRSASLGVNTDENFCLCVERSKFEDSNPVLAARPKHITSEEPHMLLPRWFKMQNRDSTVRASVKIMT